MSRKKLRAVHVGHLLSVQARVEIDCKDSLDIVLFQMSEVKAFFSELALDIRGAWLLVSLPAFDTNDKHKLSCGRDVRLHTVEKVHVSLDQFADKGIALFFQPASEIELVFIEAFG